ncbi:MAG: hypothetical protein MI807_20255, partial [Verrucomicrobiales bacterium]|nr:hypothetical protein [Verrucomicrobiales bacterium]
MLKWFLKLIVGSRNQRVIRKVAPIVDKINAIEKDLQSKSDDDLREMTAGWKNHLARYDLRVENYSERILRNRSVDENRETLTEWAKRFEALADEYREAASFVSPDTVAGLDNDAL